MRPVWGERPLFIVRACMITLAALAFVIWAVAAPRIVSPSPAPPLAAPAGSAPKPLKIPIRSFPAAQASISSTPILSKHASGSYSSGVAAFETRVTSETTSNRITYSIGAGKAQAAPKRPSKKNTRTKPGPQASPGSTPTPAPPAAPTTTSPAPPLTPPTTPAVATPAPPPSHAPLVQTPLVPTSPLTRPTTPAVATPAPPPSHAPLVPTSPGARKTKNSSSGHGRDKGQAQTQKSKNDKGTNGQEGSDGSSSDQPPESSGRDSGHSPGNGGTEHHGDRDSSKSPHSRPRSK